MKENLPVITLVGELIVAALLAANFYFDSQNSSYLQSKIETSVTANEAAREAIVIRLDSLDSNLHKLAKATIYIDSCQQQKTVKADRAERRGKFVGGLLKGLLPF